MHDNDAFCHTERLALIAQFFLTAVVRESIFTLGCEI